MKSKEKNRKIKNIAIISFIVLMLLTTAFAIFKPINKYINGDGGTETKPPVIKWVSWPKIYGYQFNESIHGYEGEVDEERFISLFDNALKTYMIDIDDYKIEKELTVDNTMYMVACNASPVDKGIELENNNKEYLFYLKDNYIV